MANKQLDSGLVGRIGDYTVKSQSREGEMKVQVKIVEVNTAYGQTNAVIEPVAGTGRISVRLDKVEL